MDNRYARSIAIFGEEGQLKLNNSHVAVFGLGGVGSYAVESLARSGVGKITLIDNDEYSTSNLNRQLFATEKTVGKLKTEIAKQRILEINSKIEVTLYNAFILDTDRGCVLLREYTKNGKRLETLAKLLDYLYEKGMNVDVLIKNKAYVWNQILCLY